MNRFKVLAINFGSTSTKVAVFEDDEEILLETFRHNPEDMKGLVSMEDNAQFRKPIIEEYLSSQGIDLHSFDVIVGRGGLIRPVCGGTYEVNEKMLKDLRECTYGRHVCNLGGIIAQEIAEDSGAQAFIVDPPVIDEMSEIAHLSGHPDFPRRPRFHALNQKAIGKRFAKQRNKKYEDLRLIIAHMGGGVTVGAHEYGRVIDVNNGLEGEGAFTGERPGTIAVADVLRAVFSGKYGSNFEELYDYFTKKCGLLAYTGTNDGKELVRRIEEENDQEALLAYSAMCYQIAKEIGAMATVLKGQVDAIILTGGFAYDSDLVRHIEEYVSYIAKVYAYPGEDEMLALAQGALRVLRKEEELLTY